MDITQEKFLDCSAQTQLISNRYYRDGLKVYFFLENYTDNNLWLWCAFNISDVLFGEWTENKSNIRLFFREKNKEVYAICRFS